MIENGRKKAIGRLGMNCHPYITNMKIDFDVKYLNYFTKERLQTQRSIFGVNHL